MTHVLKLYLALRSAFYHQQLLALLGPHPEPQLAIHSQQLDTFLARIQNHQDAPLSALVHELEGLLRTLRLQTRLGGQDPALVGFFGRYADISMKGDGEAASRAGLKILERFHYLESPYAFAKPTVRSRRSTSSRPTTWPTSSATPAPGPLTKSPSTSPGSSAPWTASVAVSLPPGRTPVTNPIPNGFKGTIRRSPRSTWRSASRGGALNKTWTYGEVEDFAWGDGFIAVEFEGDEPVRQVEKYGDNWYCWTEPKDLPEIGLSDITLGKEMRLISELEFEAIWREGWPQRQPVRP